MPAGSRLDERRAVHDVAAAIAPVERQAAVLVADVSGFTALTAALEAEHGRRAADRLAALMDGLLGSFTEIVGAHAGTVIDIVGDSLQAAWTVTVERDLGSCARAAGLAALAMIARVRDADAGVEASTAAASLPVRIGIGVGPLASIEIGNGGNEGEALTWGPALLDAAQVVALAEIGGIAVNERARRLFETVFDGRRHDDHWDLLAIAREASETPPSSGNAAAGAAPTAGGGAAVWTAEIRSATILFVRLFRVDEMARATPKQIHSRVALVRAATAAHDGELDKIHVDEKGMAAVVAFGLPPAPSADSAARAVGAAIDLRTELADYGIDVAIGIATGKVRAGMGRAYASVHHTIYGGAANLAARCMAASRNEILTDGATRALAAHEFAFLAPETHTLKGLGNVPLFGVGDARERHDPVALADATPIAGRRHDIALMEAFVVNDEGPRLLLLDGEVGVGKSRLAAHAVSVAMARGQAPLACRAGLLAGRASLSAWRDIASTLLRDFARRRNLRLADAQAALTEAVGETPALTPLTNPLFGRAPGNTDAVSDPDGRPRLARRLQAKVLAMLLGDNRRLVVIDDAQWLDEASTLLAADLIDLAPGLRLLIVGRSPLGRLKELLGGALSKEAQASHTVAALDESGTAEITVGMFGAATAQHPLVRWLHGRAQGNPLLTRELLRALPTALVHGGLASPGAWRDAEMQLRDLHLPQTIEDAILARLEARPLEQLGVLKAASVIRGRFGRDALLALDVPVTDGALDATIAALVADGLIVPDGGGWRFARELVPEALYDALPDAARTELHRKVVRFYETNPAARAGAGSAQIAHHWLKAGEPARALKPLRLAGLEAKRAGAYADSLHFLEAALDIALHDPTAAARLGPLRRAQLHVDVCNAHHILGDHHKAVAPAIAGLAGLWPGAPRGRLGWVWMAARESLLLTAAIAAPPLHRSERRSARARARNRLRSLATSRLSDCLFNLEGTLPAVACSLYAARSAERCGDLSLAAQPYALISYVAGLARLGRIARFLGDRAIADCARKDDLGGLHRALFAKVFLAASLGRWSEVPPLFDEALALNARYRSERHHGLMLTAVGFMHQFRGDFDAMRRTYAEVEALGIEASVDQFIEWAELVYGRLALYSGDPVAAEAHFGKSRVILGRISEIQAVFIAETMGALAILRQGRIDAVEARASELLTRARATPLQFGSTDAYGALAEIMNALLARFGPGVSGIRLNRARRAQAHLRRCARVFAVARPAAALHEGQLACLAGGLRRAEHIWRRGLTIADRLEMKYDAARLHAALASVPALPEAVRADHAARADALARACGVLGVPPLPVSVAAS